MLLFLCGDVMTGRGVDQILPAPGDPALWEGYARDAREYVALAESAAGPIPRPVPPSWPWGDALPLLERFQPDARIVNLETSVTGRGTAAAGKAVHYRMHPANIGCLTAATPSVAGLANNHVLDFGRQGLTDTLAALSGAEIRTVGAGMDASSAQRPAAVPVGGGRVLVFAAGTEGSGIPPDWAATPDRAGVHLLPDLSTDTAAEVGARIREAKRPGDVAVLSIHWGANWGYQIPAAHVRFAHELVEQGVDVVHGHSSHHPLPVEIYRERLILYGCGDFIDDYEGIGGHDEYRDDLRLMYLPSLDPRTGRLARLTIVPLQAHRMRLRSASTADVTWLCERLDRVSRPFGTRVHRTGPRTLEATPGG